MQDEWNEKVTFLEVNADVHFDEFADEEHHLDHHYCSL